ncbi:hypothetical protein PIB30_113593, partial [Stylosanthes scabra]|nr:hypothetical protein [Stylosanthes scabra]
SLLHLHPLRRLPPPTTAAVLDCSCGASCSCTRVCVLGASVPQKSKPCVHRAPSSLICIRASFFSAGCGIVRSSCSILGCASLLQNSD